MVLRRVFVLLLIIIAGLDRVEAVWGELREGIVHHEDAVTAAVHSARSPGEHGHEHASDAEHRHGDEHEHGTGTDHCTHQHGVEAPAVVAFDLVTPTLSAALVLPLDRPASRPPTGLLRPPRA